MGAGSFCRQHSALYCRCNTADREVQLLKRVGSVMLWIVIGLLLAIVAVPPFLDRHYYSGPVTAHYDGQHFHNPDGDTVIRPSVGLMMRFLTIRRAPWPDSVPVTPRRPEPRVEGNRMVATWIGHSTVLVQTAGLNILTDPIYAETAGPFGFGPRRVRAPGVRFEDLPKIDVILVSHDHYDHMDLGTLKRLWDRDRPLIVTSLGNDTVMKGAGVRAVARDWGGRVQVKPARRLVDGTLEKPIDVIVERVHHWGSRWGSDRDRALWSGFAVTLPGGNLFFAGDTGWGDGGWPVEDAKDGPYRLAILPIGAFQPRGMMEASHIGPIEAVAVFQRLHAASAIGVHWGTFHLSAEAIDAPPHVLAGELAKQGIAADRFRTLEVGRSWIVPASSP